MADKHGHIDMTYQAMSAVSGWPLDLLKQAIADLMKPDPESRSTESEGRRLELLDPDNRQWGWRVVNHEKYRAKARKAAYDSQRSASGLDAERKRQSRRVPTHPDASRPQTQTQTQTQTKNSEQIFRLLLKTSGKEPERTERLQTAIDTIGGWPKIRDCKQHDLPAAIEAFCEAYG